MKIGIDLGGTKIEIIVLKQIDTKMHDKKWLECYRQRIATPQGDYQKTLEAIVFLINQAETALANELSQLESLPSIGIGIPGAISAHNGLVKNANSTCLIGQPLQKDLQTRLNRPIAISNDANCMTVSEAIDGAAQDAEIVFGVIIGTGTGGGIAIHQQLISGENKICGEWGHNPLPWQTHEEAELKIKCYCGQTNCIETYLSGPGFLHRYQLMGGKEKSVEKIILASEDKQISADEKAIATQALKQYEQQFAKSLASVINIIDPNIIVVAGGLSNISRLYQNILNYWQEYVFSDTITTRLVKAKHGDSSGVRGAAWL